jgi:hypothetical protein
MSNRCPDCMKFVMLQQETPEVQDVSVDSDGNVTVNVRVYLTCGDCGTEMKEYNFSGDADADGASDHAIEHRYSDEDYEFSVDWDEPDATDRYQTHDRHGKPIKNFRYQKHYYGYSLTGKVTCSCGATFDFSLDEDEQASAFDELV